MNFKLYLQQFQNTFVFCLLKSVSVKCTYNKKFQGNFNKKNKGVLVKNNFD